MRIVAGALGGRRLQAPPGDTTRPTSDRVREALFSILGPLDGAAVLDLYAGSGALGLEALSRGARHATFVERDRRAATALRANVAALGLAGSAVASSARDAPAFVRNAAKSGDTYDLVFVDPPYRDVTRIAGAIGEALVSLLAPGGRLVFESDHRAPPQLRTPPQTERRYGDTLIRIYAP